MPAIILRLEVERKNEKAVAVYKKMWFSRIAIYGNEKVKIYSNKMKIKWRYIDMRIAVTYENGEIFQHFGHTESFKIYDVENGVIVAEEVMDTNGSGHGALATLLAVNKVDTLICGGIGMGAQMALAEAGVKLYGGVSGSVDEAVKALLDGTLEFNPEVRCNHHDAEHEHHSNCGSGGCGSHSCNH